MTRSSANALAVSRPVIQFLMLLNAVYGLILAVLLVYSFFISGWPLRPLGAELVAAYPWAGTGLRAAVGPIRARRSAAKESDSSPSSGTLVNTGSATKALRSA